MVSKALVPLLGPTNKPHLWATQIADDSGGDWFATAQASGEVICHGGAWPLASGDSEGLLGPLGASRLVLGANGALRIYQVTPREGDVQSSLMCSNP